MTDGIPPTGAAPPTDNSATPNGAGSGLDRNVAGALSYILGLVTGVLFLVIDGHRPFVRFHAMQAITVTAAMIVLWILLGILGVILGVIPVIGWIVGVLLSFGLSLAGFVLWLYLMYRAWQGDEWEVPIAGQWARQLAARR